ncbi:MAG: GGDEF domain-containing protein [Bacilli bacterium]|nr:GGDEF domain-containing protein [Bacilli bacterium]MDD4808598.1 GGDEF domain-containing protein [Bacilli bacterium]
MKNKKWIVIGTITILILISAIGFFTLNREDNDTTLTILEKRWIENNKNTIIDLGILNNVSLLNYDGEGILFDFLESLEEDTELSFNKVSYKLGEEIKTDYAFKMVDKVDKKDILIYGDNYAVLTKHKTKYSNLNELKELTIGVLNDKVDNINTYLDGNLKLMTFDSNEQLLAEINKEEPTVDAIILPKLVYLNNYNANNPLYIAYNITEIKDNYVLSLGKNDKLNDILNKYFQKWYAEKYQSSYYLHLSNTYFIANEIDEQTKVKFRSKRYIYGYVDNLPYDTIINGDNVGINYSLINKFSEMSNIEVIYKKYDSYTKLLKEFNANNIDFYFNHYQDSKYLMDVYQTVSPYEEKAVVISSLNNEYVINSINSLKYKQILVLKNTQIADFLKKKKIETIEYPNMKKMLEEKEPNSILVINAEIYNYYIHKDLEKHKIDYSFNLNTDYEFVIRDIKNNELFQNYFNFYLGFIVEKNVINEGYKQILAVTSGNTILKNLTIIGISALVIVILVFVLYKFKRKTKKSTTLTKEDKLKYVDMLTSLKNRNYLNDNIEKWDDSEVYPQTIIIIDLNNVAYINDNYGHREGDNVIKEAANILITNQIPNSDIIRTNGNEFLIYLVDYDEKQVIAYIRKLNKEFKELAHGFGAAIGYSVINDQIKTIDDAINEATLDMRVNKEELNN